MGVALVVRPPFWAPAQVNCPQPPPTKWPQPVPLSTLPPQPPSSGPVGSDIAKMPPPPAPQCCGPVLEARHDPCGAHMFLSCPHETHCVYSPHSSTQTGRAGHCRAFRRRPVTRLVQVLSTEVSVGKRPPAAPSAASRASCDCRACHWRPHATPVSCLCALGRVGHVRVPLIGGAGGGGGGLSPK